MVTIEDNKINPSKKIIDNIKPQIIYIPLKSTYGYTYELEVKIGDYVCKDDVIGICKKLDFPIHASVSGFVVNIIKKRLPNNELVDTVVIENDFKERCRKKVGRKRNIRNYTKEEYILMLKNNGITGGSGNDYPTYLKYLTKNKINTLIINAVESEIYKSCDNAIMYQYTEDILETIDAIMDIIKIDNSYIAINKNNTKLLKRLLKYKNTYPNIKIYGIEDGYPSGYEKNIIYEITGKYYKENPCELGIIVHNTATIYSIHNMLLNNNPTTERIVSITGDSVKNRVNIKIKIGTCLQELINYLGGYSEDKLVILAGGLMMGKSISDDNLIITKNLHTICLMKPNNDIAYPCIKCGKCFEVCPVDLMPILIVKNKNRAKKLKIDKCIECGLCSYVCPSKIEIKNQLQDIKKEIT